jgi:DNA-binding NtrC family response regulator
VADFQVKTTVVEATVQKDGIVNLKNQEIKMIRKTLQSCKYNQKATADILGITRDALIRKMKKYEITVGKHED